MTTNVREKHRLNNRVSLPNKEQIYLEESSVGKAYAIWPSLLGLRNAIE
ncbi:unnamed protein product [Musa textilis]